MLTFEIKRQIFKNRFTQVIFIDKIFSVFPMWQEKKRKKDNLSVSHSSGPETFVYRFSALFKNMICILCEGKNKNKNTNTSPKNP